MIDKIRSELLQQVRAYGDFVSREPLGFNAGVTPIPVTRKIFDGDEMVYMVSAVLDGWWTEGEYTDEFERQFAKWIGTRFASFCNSGSSANFLALGACTSHLLGDRRLRPGDPVITTAAGFPTTINPILFWRLKPIFLDVDIGTYLPRTEDIFRAIEEFCVDGRGAVMIAHTLGNPWRADLLRDHEGIFIIEDNCDALGSTIRGDTDLVKKTGTLGHLATHSFYPAHHITTGEGGMVVTDNGRLKKAVESIRDWGRDCWCPPGKDNTCGKRFDQKFRDLPEGYDHKYVYSHLGLNLKSTDIQAALGLAQLKRLDGFVERRKENFNYLRGCLEAMGLDDFFYMPQATHGSDPSWFGFPLTIRGCESLGRGLKTRSFLDRTKLMCFLNERKIGTRLLFASNYIRQPVFRNMLDGGWVTDFSFDHLRPFENTNKIVDNTFWIACHPGLSPEMIEYMAKSIKDFVNGH